MKTCIKCLKTKECVEFSKASREKDGLQHNCKICNKTYREQNLDKIKEYNRDWYSRNREKVIKDARIRVLSDPDKYKTYLQNWRENNPEVTRQYAINWKKENPERSRELARLGKNRRRAREYNAFVEDVYSLILLELDDGACGICGEDVDPFRYDIDHIFPLSKGGEHSYINTQIAHPSCNYKKGDKIQL